MSEQDYRATLVQIAQLAREWQDCNCAGGCNLCIDRVCEIVEVASNALSEPESSSD